MAEQKYCTRAGCGKPIKWPPFVAGVKSHPLNMDGTPHQCQAAPAAAPKEDSRIGTYGGISLRRINLTLKNGSIMVTEATPDLLKCLTDPNAAIKTGMKIKLVFAKDGKAEKAEICPDQPAPVDPHTDNGFHVHEPVTPQGDKKDCTSSGTPAPVQPVSSKIPKVEMLADMAASGPDGYWRAKFYLDLRRCEEIRQQAERKNWHEAISLAIAYQQARPCEGETVFQSAKKIHDFVAEKTTEPAGVQ